MSRWTPIPGETPLPDLSGLRRKGIHTRSALNIAEADNIRKTIVKYFATRPTRRRAPFDLKWVKKLHTEMFGKVWVWAGVFRDTETNIGVEPRHIETSVHQLLVDLAYWKKAEIPSIEQAAMLHHRAVQIHPFLNGNGRWSRLLANIWLRAEDHPVTEWPEEAIGGASLIRNDYLAAIRAADGGDYAALMELHRRYTPQSS